MAVVSVDKEDKSVMTDGCGCCSNELKDKDKILSELEDNIDMVIESCSMLGVNHKDFINQILNKP